jgi:hypothetical protein
MSQIRYKIADDIDRITLAISDENPYTSKVSVENRRKSQILIPILLDNIYFVDILSVDEEFVKIKLYMPNGDIHIGWILTMWIDLHFTGNVYDGRFNS